MREIIRFTKSQSAQGMVEFALVLPVLMLIILGVFAFGHYFFSYSSIVSASREAARWGAATGASTNGVPRYQDCKAMRDAAVRVGAFAGVTPSTVTIQFDHGPNADGSPAPYETCTGDVASGNVVLGDRILITINVPYRPIVPLVQMPNVNIRAVTNRTVIKELAAGEVPTAVSLVPVVSLAIISIDHEPSEVGQPITVVVDAIGSDGTAPVGTISIRDSASPTNNILCSGVSLQATAAPNTTEAICTYTYTLSGDYYLLAHYTPGGSPTHFQARDASLFLHQVIPGQTTTFIHDITNPSLSTDPITVTAHVQDTITGLPIQVGTVSISPSIASGSTKSLGPTGDVSFTFTPNWVGMQSITVNYGGVVNQYNSSSASVNHVVNTPTKKTVSIDVTANPVSGSAGVNQPISFTITVTDPSNSGFPTGWVTLADTFGNGCSGQNTLSPQSGSTSSSITTCTASFSNAATYSLTARYGGDTAYNGSSSLFIYAVGGAAGKLTPTITIAGNPTTDSPGQEVAFTITVSGTGGTPSGTVNLSDGTHTCLGSNPISLSNGQAICRMVFTNPGVPTLTANYSGDAVYNTGSGTITYPVNTVPSWCPTASAVTSSTQGISFTVTNSDANLAESIQSIKVYWAGGVTANLQEVRFDAPNKIGTSCFSNGGSACVWDSQAGMSRQDNNYITLNGSTTGWIGGTLNKSSAKDMWYQFSTTLPTGLYIFDVTFTNSTGGTCNMVVETSKN